MPTPTAILSILVLSLSTDHWSCTPLVTIKRPLYMMRITATLNPIYIIHWMYGAICILIESRVLVILYSLAYCHWIFEISLSWLSCALWSSFTLLAKLSRTVIGLDQKFTHDDEFAQESCKKFIAIIPKSTIPERSIHIRVRRSFMW